MSAGVDIAMVYAEHSDGLLRFFARRTGDGETALDLWSETFAQAVRGQHRCRARSAEQRAAWLYAIARNQLALFHRRGRVETKVLARLRLERPVASEELVAAVEQRARAQELRELLGTELAELTPAVRTAVELRIVTDLSYAQIAERLGVQQAAARARVSRGLTALADSLDQGIIRELRDA